MVIKIFAYQSGQSKAVNLKIDVQEIYSRTSRKRTPSGPEKSVRLWEVKNENMTKCPLTRDFRLREGSVSGGSTVSYIFFFILFQIFKGQIPYDQITFLLLMLFCGEFIKAK